MRRFRHGSVAAAALLGVALPAAAETRPVHRNDAAAMAAVSACAAEAQRVGRGPIRIDNVARLADGRYRVTGSGDAYDRYGYARYGRYFAASLAEIRFFCLAGAGAKTELRFGDF